MTTSHTPGPWFADASFVGSAAIDRFFVACNSKDLPGGRDEAEANARLIAAAPALLEALQQLLEHGEFTDYPNTRQWNAVQAARAAIAAATQE